MTNADEAKSMARQLRAALSSEGIEIPHSKSLEVVAKTLGHADWNTASARLDQKRASPNKVHFVRCALSFAYSTKRRRGSSIVTFWALTPCLSIVSRTACRFTWVWNEPV
ncbi:hypothetical protein SAMN05428995_105162 [Loktanella sp. DSM 29012]|nr:hypothetical protein SAMN05428995_105162 [Loktanella sp. DSM 29012]